MKTMSNFKEWQDGTNTILLPGRRSLVTQESWSRDRVLRRSQEGSLFDNNYTQLASLNAVKLNVSFRHIIMFEWGKLG